MRLLLAASLCLVTTSALASRTPTDTAAVTYYEPQVAHDPAIHRHRHRHTSDHHRHRIHSDRHGTVKEVMRHADHGRPPVHSPDKPQPRPSGGGAAPPPPPPGPVLDPLEGLSRSAVAFLSAIKVPEVFEDGMAMPRPPVVVRRPYLLTGTLTIAAKKFAYASGGRGWSIPYGTVEVTPDEVGPWGKRHGAIGLAGDSIYDKQLGRDREGIEIHAARHMASAGCVVVEEFDTLKRVITGMIETAGHAFLHIGPSGAAITATKESPLPPIIYLAEHVADEERHSEHQGSRHHHRLAERLPHRQHYAHHHHRVHIAKA